MTHEEQRELQVLSDAEELGKYYRFKKEPELAATARRLGREPMPRSDRRPAYRRTPFVNLQRTRK